MPYQCRYYPAPVIESIWPATLPRYGSYSAWVTLQDGLSAVLNSTVRSPTRVCAGSDALSMQQAASPPVQRLPSATFRKDRTQLFPCRLGQAATLQPTCTYIHKGLLQLAVAEHWSYHRFSFWAQVASFEPAVRVLGAGEGGGHLDLPANLTANDREVAFTMPEQSNPLPAGSFVVQLSLNGGADFSGGPAHSEQVTPQPNPDSDPGPKPNLSINCPPDRRR